MSPPPASAASNKNFCSVVSNLYSEYLTTTPSKLKLVDAYMFGIMLTGIFQFVYCCLVGTFPFNAFLAGFISTVASFVLAGKLMINKLKELTQKNSYRLFPF